MTRGLRPAAYLIANALAGLLIAGIASSAPTPTPFAQPLSAPVPQLPERRRAGQERGWLGVELEPMPGPGPGTGARVKRVVRGSPAEKAGIRTGDRLTHVERVPVQKIDDAIRKIGAPGAGAEIALTLLRGGNTLELHADLSSVPDPEAMLRAEKIGTFAPTWKGLPSPSPSSPASLGELRGRVIVIDFWATWCGVCRIIAPHLSTWQSRYGAQGLSVVGITDDPALLAGRSATQLGMTYPVLSDESEETQRSYGVQALPTLFIIDKRGVIRDIVVGYEPGREAAVERLLRVLLSEP